MHCKTSSNITNPLPNSNKIGGLLLFMALLFNLLPASALAEKNINEDYSNLVSYACENGRSLQVNYVAKGEDEYALLIADGKEQAKLVIEPSGSGVLYSDGKLDWHTKDQTGLLIKGEHVLKCTQKSTTKKPEANIPQNLLELDDQKEPPKPPQPPQPLDSK